MNVCKKYDLNFYDETKLKFGKYGKAFYYEAQRVFKRLPLATIIENSGHFRFFIVHGGISDKTDIDFIFKDIKRKRFKTISMSKQNTRTESKKKQAEALCDCLWSDPSKRSGCHENKKRGLGALFGEDVCQKFCKKNDFNIIFRSHEVRSDGFSDDNHYCKTVFSSSKYCGGRNKAAVVKVSGDKNAYKVHSFDTKHLKVEDSALEKKFLLKSFKSILTRESDELNTLFKSFDHNSDGYITVRIWADIISNYLNEIYSNRIDPKHLIVLKDYLVPTEGSKVLYSKMFNKDGNSREKELLNILIDQIFDYIDSNNDGVISMKEMTNAIKIINRKAHKHYDSESFFNKFDTNQDGVLTKVEIKNAFLINHQFIQ
jgi:Ca2+-binding EF-hand superfamily protein